MSVGDGFSSRRKLLKSIMAAGGMLAVLRARAARANNEIRIAQSDSNLRSSTSGSDRSLKTGDIRDYLSTLDGGWVDREHTVDTFKSGGPDVTLTGIAVAWMSDIAALQKALDLHCNLFITHEPTFYNHFDYEEDIFRDFMAGLMPVDETFANKAVRAKRRFIDASGITILRCHDLWDQVPGMGIPDAWAKQLGFDHAVAGEGYYRVFDVSGRTAENVAKQVAQKTRDLGQEAVQLIGQPDKQVRRVAIGTGAITPIYHMIAQYDVDLVICSDDGFWYWRDGPMAEDMGIPIIIAHHGVSEVPGMRMLAEHLSQKFSQVPVHFIPQPCMYKLVRA